MTAHFWLQESIHQYACSYPEELSLTRLFLELLTHPDAYSRTHLPGHITGSAFIISEDQSQTLLVHHGKLNRWLQPGGHADGDTDILAVALREANEETGLSNLTPISAGIYDLDIHPIPERKDFPAHNHYDVRFLVRASLADKLQVSHESHDVKWIPLTNLEKYNKERSVLRLRKKIPL